MTRCPRPAPACPLSRRRPPRVLRGASALQVAVVAAALWGATAAGAQQGPAGAPAAPAASATATVEALHRADRNFLEKAAQGGAAEVALGKLAQERASSSAVKTFADRMVQDHGKANDDLMRLVRARGLPVSAQPSSAQQHDAEQLVRRSGADFDRAYMKHMVEDHQKDVAAFQMASRTARDPEVKDFALRTLPTLESHLQLAQTTYDALRSARGSAPAASR